MNTLEGFFGVGAIVGPALLTRLLAAGLSWKWLYVIAGGLCVVLVVLALLVRYPETPRHAASTSLGGTVPRCAIGTCWRFRRARFLRRRRGRDLRVDADAVAHYTGSAALLAPRLSVFFLLRAAGRFLGAWMLRRAGWQLVLMVFSGGILACFAFTVIGGVTWGVFLLPLSGLFMSVMYPTINSKGISSRPNAITAPPLA